MQKSILCALAVGACALASHAGTTWFFNGGNDTSNGGVSTPSKWVDADGHAATAFSVDDNYMVRNYNQIRVKNYTFAGGPIQFGNTNLTGTQKFGRLCLDNSSGRNSFPNGLYFDSGYCWINAFANAFRVGQLDACWIRVRSPISSPFVFYSNSNAGYNPRRLRIEAPLESDENAGIVIGPAVVEGLALNCGTNFTMALVGDCSNYMGAISVTTAQDVAFGDWDTSLLVGDITVAGRVSLASGTMIEARDEQATNTINGGAPSEATIGSLELSANSVIQVSGNTTTPTNGIIHVRNSLSVAGPVEVRLNYNAQSVNANTETTRIIVMTAPSSSRLDATDFVLAAASTTQYCYLDVEEDTATNTKSLVVVLEPTVTQINQFSTEGNKDRRPSGSDEFYPSSLTNAAHWSDGQLPHSGAHYYSGGRNLRTLVDETSDYVFPGLSFTQKSGQLVMFTRSFQVPEYIVSGIAGSDANVWLGQSTGVKTIKVNRFVAKSGAVNLGAYNDQTLVIDGEIVGDAHLKLRGVTSTSAPTGYYMFTGLNTNFTGNITVEQQVSGDNLTFGRKFQTLYVEDGRNLGGAKDTFDPAALKLAAMSRLSATNGNVTLESDLNRGLYIDGVGRLYVRDPYTLTVNWPITMHGKLWKEGTGTLVLGGDARFDSADGEPEATSNLFEVAGGTLKVAAYNALDGIETTFDNDTSLVLAFDANDTNLTKYGLLNAKTETPFVLGSGLSKLPLSFDISAYPMPDVTPFTVGIVTVTNTPATVAAVRDMLPRIKAFPKIHNFIVERENDGEGTVTFELLLKQVGTQIIFR